jgi:hypothetical protein
MLFGGIIMNGFLFSGCIQPPITYSRRNDVSNGDVHSSPPPTPTRISEQSSSSEEDFESRPLTLFSWLQTRFVIPAMGFDLSAAQTITPTFESVRVSHQEKIPTEQRYKRTDARIAIVGNGPLTQSDQIK